MSMKFIVKVLLIGALLVAIFEGVPQKSWQLIKNSTIGEQVYSWIGGNQNLSGLLRGPLEGLESSYLTNTGIVEWTNNQRTTQGLSVLKDNMILRKAAENKLEDMFAQQYFEHKSPDGKMPSDLAKNVNYEYVVIGENLALGNFKDDKTLVEAWMNSPGHRANILNKKYEEIGTAARKGMFEGKEVWLAVQEFGKPLSSCPSTSTNLKSTIDANRAQLATMQSDLQKQKQRLEANQFASQAEYNSAVNNYNSLANSVNKLSSSTQELVREYNDGVTQFNKCIQSNT